MKLVVVESPGKIRKIQGFLGSGEYRVAASFGHVRDLPERDLGVSFLNGQVDVTYQNIGRNSKHISALKAAARDADEVILATDPDREGEAIAWHVRELLGARKHHYTRIEFNQITKQAVVAALRKPRTIDDNLVNAQQARRVLDRLVGWMVSPVCWKKIGKGTSAGRVQSVAVRLVVEREREIRDFRVEVYHELWAWLWPQAFPGGQPVLPGLVAVEDKPPPGPPGAFRAKLVEINGKQVARTLVEPEWALILRERLLPAAWTVRSVEKKERLRHAPPPFVTSTLQQAASNVMRWKPRRTMQIAQSLYEAGLITYMRTDSPSMAPEAVRACREFIGANFPPPFLPPSPRYFKAKSAGAQEAHECVRPTDVSKTPDQVAGQKPEAARLYRLIWERAVASQMSAAVYDDTVAVIDARANDAGGAVEAVFEAKGSVQRFAGWLALTKRESDREDEKREDGEGDSLPDLHEREALRLARLDVRRAKTEPPRRYSQAALIRALEKEGIGRPATYAAIMDTIISRGYVEEIERSLHATDLGERLVDLLVEGFEGHFIELGFTREAESALDLVADGKQDWEALVIAFKDAIDKRLNLAVDLTPRRYGGGRMSSSAKTGGSMSSSTKGDAGFQTAVGSMPSSADSDDGDASDGKRISRMSDLPPVPLGKDCPLCGKQLERREGRFGKYVTCSAGKECRYKCAWLTEAQQAKVDALGPVSCPKCKGVLVPRVNKQKKTVFLSCLRYPECDGSVDVEGKKKTFRRGGKGGAGTEPADSRGDDPEDDSPVAKIIPLHPTKPAGWRAESHGYAIEIGDTESPGNGPGNDPGDDAPPPPGIFEMPVSRFGLPKSDRPASGGLKRGKGLRPVSKKKQAERAANIRESRDALRNDVFASERPANDLPGSGGFSRGSTGGLKRNTPLRNTSSPKSGGGFGKSKKVKGDGRFGPVVGKGSDAGFPPAGESMPSSTMGDAGFQPADPDVASSLSQANQPTGIMPRCPKCDSPMVQRKSKHGPFFGCSLFPNCRGTRPMA